MRLKKLRKDKKITQLQLAIELNMSQNTISRYETGERQAGYVSIDYLLERTNIKKY